MTTPLWFQILWAALGSSGLSYYLYRSWHRRSVTVFGFSLSAARRGFNGDASRDSDPAQYWFAMFCWFLFDLIFLFMLGFRTYQLLTRP
jgi:hypothetical protein